LKKSRCFLLFFMCHRRRFPVFPKARGFRRLWRPGSMVRALRVEPWVRPTERAGSEGVIKNRCAGEVRRLLAPILYADMPPLAAVAKRHINSSPTGRYHHPLNPGGVSRPLLRQHILHIMLFHFFFLSPADGDGGAAFQEEGVLLHGLYVIHVDDEAMVALKESGVV
jgi:hypothetical protein